MGLVEDSVQRLNANSMGLADDSIQRLALMMTPVQFQASHKDSFTSS
jgi:hypothetical protein